VRDGGATRRYQFPPPIPPPPPPVEEEWKRQARRREKIVAVGLGGLILVPTMAGVISGIVEVLAVALA
jgi:hypothetical protein